jgi:hypothetical protein
MVYPEPIPHGAVETAFTIGDMLAPGLSYYAPGTSFMLYGGPALMTHLAHSEFAGDMVEAVMGSLMILHEGYKTGAAFRRMVQREKGIVPAAEKVFTTAVAAARDARNRAMDLWHNGADARRVAEHVWQQKVQEAESAVRRARTAEARAKAAADTHHAAELNRVQQPPTHMPTGDVARVVGLPENMPDREAVGRELQRLDIGEGGPGEREGGVRAGESGLSTASSVAYKARDARASTVGLGVSNSDGAMGVIKADIESFYNARLPSTYSMTERKLMEELVNMLGYTVTDQGGELKLMTPVLGISDDRIPFARLSEVYSRMSLLRPARGSPRAAMDSYRSVVTGLHDLIIALESADPEVARLGTEARLLHGAEQEFAAQVTKPTMAPGRTPVGAAKLIFPFGEGADLTRAKKVLLAGSEQAQEGYVHGWWRQLLERSTDRASGMVNLETLAKEWAAVPDDWKAILSAESMPQAGTKLNELLGRRAQLEDVAHASDAEIEKLLSKKDIAAAEFKEAADNTTKAIKAMAKAQIDAERVGTHYMGEATAARDEWLRQRQIAREAYNAPGQRMGMMGRAGVRASVWATSAGAALFIPGVGPAGHFAAQGIIAWLFMKAPLTAAESLRTPAQTLNGAKLAALINALTQGWRGMQQQNEQQDQPQQQGQQ